MRARRLRSERVGVFVTVTLAACGPTAFPDDEGDGSRDSTDDVAAALAALPNAEVLLFTADGVPTYIVGEMAKIGPDQTDDLAAAAAALEVALAPVVAPFRLTADELVVRKLNIDDNGNRHFRYRQVRDGLDVIGGDLVVHVDIKGSIYGINGAARGDLPAAAGGITGGEAVAVVAGDPRFAQLATATPREVYLITLDSTRHRAYEVVVQGFRGQDPARDKVYVDRATGDIVAVYPQIHFAEHRRVHSANNSTSLPGTLRRSEGQAATSDADVNAAYDNTGAAYEAYNNFWSRDSYDNAGGRLISSVHYSTNFCNAYWDGAQMVYGDGSGPSCLPLARSLDVTAHELTHGVTEHESGLVYTGEPGGMNEALSDIFGAFVEAWVDGGKTGALTVSNDTWLIGEDILPPALRHMCDPAADGASADVWTNSVGSLDVHFSSGIGNLAFCLLTRGGGHPRGRTAVTVPPIGMTKAIRILYKAQTDILTSTSRYSNVRVAMEQAAVDLGYDQATRDAVGCAWAAVAVGTAPASCGGAPPPPTDGVLAPNVPVTAISDSVGGQRFWRIDVPAGQASLTISINGGTGDADLYVRSGERPTQSVYTCRPYQNGNAETCTFRPPTAGTYWVMLHAYAAYSGVTLTGSYTAGGGGGGDPYLTNGTAITSINGAAEGAQYWRIATPAGRTLTVRISGGTGDADLYTRFGSRPTTSTYACRPYQNGNNETCTTQNTSAGDYYVMIRGFTAYSGLTLVGSY
jgi:vibriolysin